MPFEDRQLLWNTFHEEIKAYDATSVEISGVLDHMIRTQQWDHGYGILGAIYLKPSRDYIPVLCRIVDADVEEAPIEPAIERLADMPDPVAVPCLTKALGYRHGQDFGFSVPKKALWALSRIDTQEAWEAIAHTAKASDEECICEAAQWYLDHRGEL